MTAPRTVDARLVLPGEWVLPPIGWSAPGLPAGMPGRVHHVEVLPGERRDEGPQFEVAVCLLQRGGHPGHTAGDARNGADAVREHPTNTPQSRQALMPEPWPILWLALGDEVLVVPAPPKLRVAWTGDGWAVIREGADQ